MKSKQLVLAALLAVGTLAAQASTISLTQGSAYQQHLGSADDYRTSVEAALLGATPTSVDQFSGVATSGSTVEFDIAFDLSSAQAGNYAFTFGLDLGGGGAIFLDGAAVSFHPEDMWWGNGQEFLFSQALAAGHHSIGIYGYEGCCWGLSYGLFAKDGASPVTFGSHDGLAPVAEPQTLALMLAGLGALALRARRRSL